MDIELAETITRGELERAISKNPNCYDFRFYPSQGGKTYAVHWFKDVGVKDPKWHISVEEFKLADHFGMSPKDFLPEKSTIK